LQIEFGDSPWSLRAEWRLRRTFDSDASLTDQVGSLGVQYSFGGGAKRAAPPAVAETAPVQEAEPVEEAPVPIMEPDTDGDGITDDRDLCPGTMTGAKVDANGCEEIPSRPSSTRLRSTSSTRRHKRWHVIRT
jgi:hypothetical protein